VPDEAPSTRGSLQFQITPAGDLANSAVNVQLLAQLWADRTLIRGDDLGPGDPCDFDHGAWHSSCHLLGAGGARRAADGRILWLEVSHALVDDEYFASVTFRDSGKPATVPLDSAEGRSLVESSTLLGFVEGNSTGRASARYVFDAPDRFNLWRRQDFDQPVTSPLEGGKVWEHWCTLRDLRPPNRVGLTAITAYVSLVAALGDRFCAAVARGRREYGHPEQLCALVHAGFVGKESATWNATPTPIPATVEPLFLEAESERALEAVEQLNWEKPPRYYMFERRLKSWSTAAQVKADLKKFASAHKLG
jgi:hypothetical protein